MPPRSSGGEGTFGAVNSFLALDASGTDVKGLSVVTRRFDEIIGVEAGQRANSVYPNSFANEDVLEMAGPGRVATPALAAGDAIFIDEMTVHRTAAVPKQPKVISWFCAPSRFPEHRHPLRFG